MSDSTTNELVSLERQYWQAIQDKDLATMMRLTDDPCIVTGAQGVGSLGHKALSKMMQGAPWTLDSFEIGDDILVRLLREDIAVVAYSVKEVLTVEGKQLNLKAADASTWIRREGGWVCALHTEAISGDPFGRDRHD